MLRSVLLNSFLTCAQVVWIAKVLKLPTKVVPASDGSVTLHGMQLAFYQTRKNKAKGAARMPIFGNMIRCETLESTKTKKQYCDLKLKSLGSDMILRAFDPSTYLVRTSRAEGANNKQLTRLMQEHVKEATEFFVSRSRYMAWLSTESGGGEE